MPKLLSLSRAARLAGVSRAEIQRKIREQNAKTFEGKLSIVILKQLYPHLEIEADPVFDRIQRIKAEARPKSRYSDGWLPDQETLVARLKEFHRTLVHAKSTLNVSEALVKDALDELIRSVENPEKQLRTSVNECIGLLQSVLKRMHRASSTTVTQINKEPLPTTVSANVRILPSDHEFQIEGNDSILEAGLKAGFYLDYGCTSHNCGKCKCRVVSGEVYKIADHDYFLSAKEQEDGYILGCCHTADSDLVIEANEAGVEEELPWQEIRAVVRKTWLEDQDLALLHIQTPRSQTLRFKAGQQVELSTEDGNVADLYIASCPCDGRNLQFMVAREPGNPLSEQVFGQGLGKQTVMLKGPSGHFVLREESTSAVLFLAKAKGFAPIKSLLEQAINIDHAEGLHLIQIDCFPPGSTLDNLCRTWNDSLDDFLYTTIDAETRLPDLLEQLASAVAGAPQVDIYIAGPADWLASLMKVGQSRGLEPENWYCQAVD